MTSDNKRRQSRSRQTKAQLIEELEGLESELAAVKLGQGLEGEPADGALPKSEEWLHAVFEHSPAAILLKAPDGRYLMANRTWHEWFNPNNEEIVGKTVYDFFSSNEHAKKITAYDRQVVETGKVLRKEHITVLSNGTELDTILHKFPIRDSDGNIVAVSSINIEFSEKKRAEEALRQSENRLDEALQSLQQAFALYDADDRLITFNEEYERLRPGAREIMEQGGTFEDMIRKNIELEIIPEAYGREEEFIKERVKKHKNPKGTIIRRFKDGTWSRIEEVRTPSGGIALSFVDITDLKKAEEALEKSEALFRTVVDYSPTKIHIKDVEGRYILINKEAGKLFGISDEEGRGKTSYDLFPKEIADSFMAHDTSVIESGQATEEEEEFTLDDGTHTYLTVKFPIYGPDGITGVGAIGTDITERVRVEVALRAAKEEAEYANRSKTEFLANMSHELRTPLNSILGFSEILMTGDMEKFGQPKTQEYAKDIHYSGSHLLRLINEVLDLSKLEVGEIEIAEDEIDVADVIKTCIKMVEGRSIDKKICLSIILKAGLPRLLVDELRFKQILINLLGNAVKFTPPGGEVTVSARVNGKGEYIFEVEDTGIGIAAGDIPKVLEPFGQVHDILTRNHEGSGLGLHLAKSFTELHGGTLKIESTPGEGTAVILTFPKERTVRTAKKRA